MPKQRKYKTLTEGLKARIKENPNRYKDSELSGKPLAYKHRVKSAKKARKAKADKEAVIDELRIPKDSESYQMVKDLAAAKGITVKKLVKDFRNEIGLVLEDGGLTLERESDYLIKDLKGLARHKRVFVNDGDGYSRLSKEAAILRVQMLLMHCAALTDIFMLIYRVTYQLDGDIKFTCPDQSQYEDIILETEIKDFLDEYEPEIIYIESNRKTEA